MGIQIEFNPDLALRNIREHGKSRRSIDECIPDILEVGKEHEFRKKGQRVYYLLGPVPLCETEGNGKLSEPIAGVQIIEPTHKIINGEIYTTGRYRVLKLKDPNDSKPLFVGWEMQK